MTNEELKKKIADVLRENIEYELHYFPDDNYTEVEFDYDKLADALITTGIGDIKRIANEERKQAVQEFVEEFKSRHFFMMATYMKNPIYQCTGDELDRLVKEVCGE